MGVFPRDGGLEAPAAVIGFQLPMKSLLERFLDITSKSSNPELKCSNDIIDCYLIDQNGYIVVSNDTKYPVGSFFGDMHASVMCSMVQQGIFTPVVIYDYQALCENIVSFFFF